jgi:hypothetical protein
MLQQRRLHTCVLIWRGWAASKRARRLQTELRVLAAEQHYRQRKLMPRALAAWRSYALSRVSDS